MNIQRKNSAHHFRMQSEREQTLTCAEYMTKTQNLLLFSLKCHQIYPGIHKDPSIGTQT